MNIVIRVDASIHIGSGHVMRCLVLANSLRDQGHEIYFASRPQKGDLIEFVRNKGFIVKELIAPKIWLEPLSSSDYAAWLQVSWQDDVQDLFDKIENIDMVIVDHYGLNEEWESKVRTHYTCRLVVIDDLVRTHQADIIIDQTLLRNISDYQLKNPLSTILAGCDFALLKPLFSSYRNEVMKQRKELADPIQVLVTMGGIDNPNATLKILEVLFSEKNELDLNITVLLSPKAPHYDEVSKLCLKHINKIKHIDFVDNMAELMSNSCIAIGAPGSTSWERACLGIPSIIVPIAENQRDIANNLELAEAAIKVELSEIEDNLVSAIKELVVSWKTYHNTNLELCDGLGSERVLQYIQELL